MKLEFTENEVSTLLVALHAAKQVTLGKAIAGSGVYKRVYTEILHLIEKVEREES